MSSQKSVTISQWRQHQYWAKGLWTLGGSIVSAVAGLRAGIKPAYVVERGCGQTTEGRGVCVPAL
jgi:hypothetical protein